MNKRELIRRTAIEIIAEEGYYNTKVQIIAEQAEIAVGTVYNYFSNKEEILNYIFKVEFDKRLDILKRLKVEAISFKEKLNLFLEEHFQELETNPATTSVLVQESQLPRKHSLKAVDDFINELPELLAEMIESAKKKKEIRDVNSSLIANAIFYTIRGMASKVVLNEHYNFDQTKEELMNLLWCGIKN
ncbi:TetR/AcrR family transcriptional regulator [Orenia marismortui]|uniref:TetR family transcriptional regulator n=1 Tax=Orenia marismortui TaxID=46469 RepID=A0A4R8GYB8_9FIRM|nr:TetR/AcrR family transcriptional regulator [Orenia marismortui]TDX51409.1 TetR family transcriptional regulator [Orenia marismortui]